MNSYEKILVTGGTGLVGKSLQDIQAEYNQIEFHFTGSKECNLACAEETNRFIADKKPDAILHLAAVAGGIELSLKYPATLLRENVLMNMNVLEAARLNHIKKTVMSLSTGMYAEDCPNPIKEEYIHMGNPHPSNYSYAFAKRMVEPMIRAYRTEYKMNIIGLIPNGIFGEHCNYGQKSATMLPALIRRFYENRSNNEKLIVWGDGSPLRELTYGRDMARAFMWCLENYDQEQPLHIGTTEEHSIREIVNMIVELMEIDFNRVMFDISKPAGQHRKSTDNSKFLKISNFKYTPFKEGLRNTIDYFCRHYTDPSKIRL